MPARLMLGTDPVAITCGLIICGLIKRELVTRELSLPAAAARPGRMVAVKRVWVAYYPCLIFHGLMTAGHGVLHDPSFVNGLLQPVHLLLGPGVHVQSNA